MSKPFIWGRVIEHFKLDMDGVTLTVTKYHPSARNEVDMDEILYHSEDLHESWPSFDGLIIAWIAKKNIGYNQQALVAGVCRALGIQQ